MKTESDILCRLRFLQLADSALPIGGLSHSFGLESMIDEFFIGADDLFSYLENLLTESLLVEAVYCRTAYIGHNLENLNAALNGLRLARESRQASLALGERFLKLAAFLHPVPLLQQAANSGKIHFSLAFGYTGGILSFGVEETIAAFLRQSVVAALSAAQRLLPLGQMQSTQIAWELKPFIAQAVSRSACLTVDTVSSCSHLPELASMRHPFLSTRLFIS